MQSPSSAFCWLFIGWGTEQDQPAQAIFTPLWSGWYRNRRRYRTSPLAPGRDVVYRKCPLRP